MLTFKPYRRKLKIPIKMSRGIIEYREGVILRLDGNPPSFSEVLVMDYYATESLSESLEVLSKLPKNPKLDDLQLIPEKFSSTRFAFETLFITPRVERFMKISKLLPAGEAALEELKTAMPHGFETFKWKIGIYENEFEVFEELLTIGKNVKFRLDANAGLSFELAKKWLRSCEARPVEFIEQPLAVNEFEQMNNLSIDFTTPIALDESVATYKDLLIAEAKGWKGIYVVKPLRLGNLKGFLEWREQGKRKIVYSSALETCFGADIAIRIAASDKYNNYDLGFGVSHFFENDGLSMPANNSKVSVVNEHSALESLWQRSFSI